MSTEATTADDAPPTGSAVEPLRLLAEDADDLHIISAALQDAILRPVDIAWEPQARRVTLMFAGGGDLRIEVECLDAVLTDLSERWPAKVAPTHLAEGPEPA